MKMNLRLPVELWLKVLAYGGSIDTYSCLLQGLIDELCLASRWEPADQSLGEISQNIPSKLHCSTSRLPEGRRSRSRGETRAEGNRGRKDKVNRCKELLIKWGENNDTGTSGYMKGGKESLRKQKVNFYQSNFSVQNICYSFGFLYSWKEEASSSSPRATLKQHQIFRPALTDIFYICIYIERWWEVASERGEREERVIKGWEKNEAMWIRRQQKESFWDEAAQKSSFSWDFLLCLSFSRCLLSHITLFMDYQSLFFFQPFLSHPEVA